MLFSAGLMVLHVDLAAGADSPDFASNPWGVYTETTEIFSIMTFWTLYYAITWVWAVQACSSRT